MKVKRESEKSKESLKKSLSVSPDSWYLHEDGGAYPSISQDDLDWLLGSPNPVKEGEDERNLGS